VEVEGEEVGERQWEEQEEEGCSMSTQSREEEQEEEEVDGAMYLLVSPAEAQALVTSRHNRANGAVTRLEPACGVQALGERALGGAAPVRAARVLQDLHGRELQELQALDLDEPAFMSRGRRRCRRQGVTPRWGHPSAGRGGWRTTTRAFHPDMAVLTQRHRRLPRIRQATPYKTSYLTLRPKSRRERRMWMGLGLELGWGRWRGRRRRQIWRQGRSRSRAWLR